MDNELKAMLQQILDNQAVLFHRIDELYHSNPKSKTQRAFYNEKKAAEELKKITDSLNK